MAVSSVVAVSIGLGAGGAAASAAIPTGIQFSASYLKISYTDRQVTIAGTLQSSSGVPGGEPIVLREVGPGLAAALGTVTTDPDGTFSLTTTLPWLGSIQAMFAGDATYAPSNRAFPVYAGEHLPTRITVDPLSPITLGSTLNLTGLVEMQTPDGTWIPAPYTEVRCTNGTATGCGRSTGADGRFSLQIENFSAIDQLRWGAVTTGSDRTFASTAQSAMSDVVLSRGQTRITGFTAGPQPAIAQNGLSFTGHVDAMIDGTMQGRVPPQAGLHLYFQPRNSTTWTEVTSAWFWGGPNPGDFHVDALSPFLWKTPSYYLAEGSWQVRLEPSSADLWVPSSTDSKPIDVRVQTSINGLSVHRSGTYTRTLTGTLAIHSGTTLPSNLPRGIANKTVKIYYRAKSSGAWHYIKAVTSRSTGGFSYSLTRRPHGYYHVVFPQNGYYNSTTSSSVHFSS